MKNIGSLFIGICTIILFAVTAEAAPTLHLVAPKNATAYTVTASNFTGAAAIDFTIRYDKASLEEPVVQTGAGLSDVILESNGLTPGTLRVVIVGTNATGFAGNGTVASIKFNRIGNFDISEPSFFGFLYLTDSTTTTTTQEAVLTTAGSCDIGKMLIGGSCKTPPTCRSDQILNGSGVCQCPTGKIDIAGTCQTPLATSDCSNGMILNSSTNSCVCPSGLVLNEGYCKAPVNGACSNLNGQTLASAPTIGLCNSGISGTVNGTGPWNWICSGTSGGTDANCSVSKAISVNGSCGTSSGKSLTVAPSTDLCASGNASSIEGSGPWTWSCSGLNGGTNAEGCSAAKAIPVNGACGVSSGLALTSAPLSGLCSSGTPGSISGTGPWNWGCNGSGGGTDAYCSATLLTCTSDQILINGSCVTCPAGKIPVDGVCVAQFAQFVVTGTTNGTGGSISCTSPVTGGNTTTCTLSPATGYQINTTSGCSGSLSDHIYTTGAVNSACTVTANFILKPVNGVCGTSNGKSFPVRPAANLCSAGTAGSVANDGSWKWSCAGANNGKNADCSASIVYGDSGTNETETTLIDNGLAKSVEEKSAEAKLEAAKTEAEKAAADKAKADKLEADKAVADKIEADRIAADKAVAAPASELAAPATEVKQDDVPVTPAGKTLPVVNTGGKPLSGAIERLKSIPDTMDKFSTIKGERKLSTYQTNFVNNSKKSGFTQEPAIAISDGQTSIRMTIEMDAKGETPNFAFLGATTKTVRKIGEKTWLLEAVPEKGALDVKAIVNVGKESVDIPLVVVPEIDPIIVKRTKGLSEEGVNTLLSRKDLAPDRPAYDLNGDGKRDYLDDYILVGHYLRTKLEGEAKK